MQVLVVGRGDPEENRRQAAEHGVTFPVALQRRWEVSRQYATLATPVAYLVDEEGAIAQEAAAGCQAIVRLAQAAASGAQERRASRDL